MNLATYLVFDGFAQDYEVAVIISNDSDLVLPIRMVRDKLDLEIGIINPQQNISYALKAAATFYIPRIRNGVLGASLFPDVLKDGKGVFRKPNGW